MYPDLKASHNLYGRDLLLNGKAPQAGEVMTMPQLAETFKVSTGHLRHLLLVMLTVGNRKTWQSWFL